MKMGTAGGARGEGREVGWWGGGGRWMRELGGVCG